MTSDWFAPVANEVGLNPDLSFASKAAYMAIAAHTNVKTGQSWASLARISQCMGASRSTVIRALNELVAAGVVVKTPRFRDGRQTTNVYRIKVLPARRKGEQ